MKSHMLLIAMMSLCLIGAASCGANETKNAANESKAPAAKTQIEDAATTAAAPAAAGGWSGKVLETMNSGGYTYVKVDTGGGSSVWAAGPQSEVKAGDSVHIPDGMLMSNFESKSLGRTFEQIYFVPAIHTGGAPAIGPGAPGAGAAMGKMPEGHPDISQPPMPDGHPDISAMMASSHPDPSKAGEAEAAAALDFSEIKKAEGGVTVAEVFERQSELIDKEVTLRGKVVKFNEKILGKNWVHLRDGSGADGTNDVTVTTGDAAAVGDVVLVKGMLRSNRDFGFGYKYDLMIEDGKVTVEKAK